MSQGSHDAAHSAVGYQHQTWWALVELLRSGPERPDSSLTLEMYDDIAWDVLGTSTELGFSGVVGFIESGTCSG
ncbi:hypothetical protein ACWGJX_40280 [Streptomyces sp. NPDC054775]